MSWSPIQFAFTYWNTHSCSIDSSMAVTDAEGGIDIPILQYLLICDTIITTLGTDCLRILGFSLEYDSHGNER